MFSGPDADKIQQAPGRVSATRANLAAVVVLAVLGSLIVTFRKPLADYAHCWDFNEFYIAGQIIRNGATAEFYDFAAQARFQVQYVGPTAIADMPEEPFLYPAATAVPYLPLAWLSLKAAYAFWIAVNCFLLLVSVRRLQREFVLPQGNWPLVLALLAAPVFIGLVGGQVIFIVLLLYVLALQAMRRERIVLAGFFVGLIALKFQLMVGFVLILVLRRMWKTIGGVIAGGAVIGAVSALMVGWDQMVRYPTFIRNAAYTRHVAFPTFMVNIRGFLALFTGDEPRVWLVAAISVVVIAAAAWAWRDTETGFAVAIIATLLTAFHEYPQELTLLLIPLAIAAERVVWTRERRIAAFLLVPAITFGLFSVGAQGLLGVTCAAVLLGMLFANRRQPAPMSL